MQRDWCGAVRSVPPGSPIRRPGATIYFYGGKFLNQTNNYQLSQWDEEDRILRVDFNCDNSKVDAALKNNADSIASLSKQMADKASTSTVDALAGQLTQKGNCRIETFTYTGTGTYGSDNPTIIRFPKMPVLFVVLGDAVIALGAGGDSMACGVMQSSNATGSTSIVDVPMTWSGSQMQTFNQHNANEQLNKKDTVYRVTALYAEDV